MGWSRLTGALAKRAAAPLPSLQSITTVRTYYTIQAVPREYVGRRLAARERDMGRIPAVVIKRENSGGDGDAGPVSRKLLVTTSEKQISSLLKRVPSFCSTTFLLQVRAGSGSSVVLQAGNVLPIKVHKDEDTGKILNLVMEWAEKGSQLKVDIPVVYKGLDVCPGLQKGGYLHKMRSTIKYLCPEDNIPPTIEVDLANKDIGDKIFLHDVSVPSSLQILSKDEKLPICKIVVARPNGTEKEVALEVSEETKPASM